MHSLWTYFLKLILKAHDTLTKFGSPFLPPLFDQQEAREDS